MKKELEVAIEAAKEAGKILSESFQKSNTVTLKEDKSFQTEVDRSSEAKITSIIKEAFPNHSINAEESGLSQVSSKYLWLIDPLDGTTNYATHVPFFSISIALASEGKAALGVVYDPIHEEMFTAKAGERAKLNGGQIEVSETNNLMKSQVGYSRSGRVKEKFADLFARMEKASRTPKILGSTALQLCYVAAGRLDADLSFAQEVWDVAAGVLILREAGGKVTDFSGKVWNLEMKDVVATNGKIHSQLLEVLNR